MRNDDKRIIDYITYNVGGINTNKVQKYSYISNTDQTIRWMYPANLSVPTFLNFYNSSSLRAKIFTLGVKLLFKFRLANLVGKNKVCLSVQKNSLLQRILDKYPGCSHSIFTGTVGKNRKIIIELGKGFKSQVFVKVAISKASKELIHNEFLALSKLKDEKLTTICVPEILGYSSCEFLELSNVKPQKSKQPAKLIDRQVIALSQLNSINHIHVEWNTMSEKHEIEFLINKIKKKDKADNGLDASKINAYMEKLSLLSELIDGKTDFSCGFCHGDYTPWNMYVTEHMLYVYDWELSRNALPILFDLFHYVFQSEILINHSDYSSVKNEIERVLKLSSTRAMIEKFNVDVGMSFVFYVLYISSYYVDLYSDQKVLHQQAFWLFDAWNDAATDVLSMNNGNVFD